MIRVTVLGSGTSTGVPIPRCGCDVCLSSDPRNKRLRVSVYLELQQDSSASISPTEDLPGNHANSYGLLIDTSPDLRQQALCHSIPRIDEVLITHTHADHIFGMDDLRGFNFSQRSKIKIRASASNRETLERIFHYCFFKDPDYEGGSPPALELDTITPFVPFTIRGYEVMPLVLYHGKLEVLGFRVGGFAYLTDCSQVPAESEKLLHGLQVLLLDGLRFREHPTHFSLEQAVKFSQIVKPQKTFLTHLSHEVDFTLGDSFVSDLSKGSVRLAYDGLQFTID